MKSLQWYLTTGAFLQTWTCQPTKWEVFKVEIISKFIFKLQLSSLDSISFRPCVVFSLSLFFFNNISNVLDILTTSSFALLWFPKCKLYLFWCCFLAPHLAFPSVSLLLRALSSMSFSSCPTQPSIHTPGFKGHPSMDDCLSTSPTPTLPELHPFVLLSPWHLQSSVVQALPMLSVWHTLIIILLLLLCAPCFFSVASFPQLLKPQNCKSSFHIPFSIPTSN